MSQHRESEVELLDRGYAAIMKQIIDDGTAPHFTELALNLGIGIEAGRQLIHELVGMTPGWVHPGTDYLASFPPFNIQPTHYRISIDGNPGWYGQCGFESLAVRWMVPGKTVRVDAPCLCCGEPISIEMRDDEVLTVEPEEAVGYTSQMVGGDAASRPFR